MSVTSLSLVSGDGETISLPVTDNNGPYIVKKITGLDADEITPKFYGFSLDGASKFYDFGLPPRNVVVLIQLNPRFSLGETHASLRDQLYKQILKTRTGLVDLLFYDGASADIKVSGFITKFEAPPFAKVPTVQITLLCKDPMLRGTTAIYTPGSELPTNGNLTIVDSLSNAPHGFKLQITATAFVGPFTIQDTQLNPSWFFTVFPDQFGVEDTDILYISSEFGSKNVYVIRSLDGSPETIYLMDRVYPESTWPVIFPGSNPFYIEGATDFTINYLEYTPAYWGL